MKALRITVLIFCLIVLGINLWFLQKLRHQREQVSETLKRAEQIDALGWHQVKSFNPSEHGKCIEGGGDGASSYAIYSDGTEVHDCWMNCTIWVRKR